MDGTRGRFDGGETAPPVRDGAEVNREVCPSKSGRSSAYARLTRGSSTLASYARFLFRRQLPSTRFSRARSLAVDLATIVQLYSATHFPAFFTRSSQR